jgi:flavodoxin
MMKKILYGILFLVIFLTGCGQSQNEETENGATTDNTAEVDGLESEQVGNGGVEATIAIAYFTRPENLEQEPEIEAVSRASFNIVDGELAGDVRILAEMIAEETGGELFSIQTVSGYPNIYDEHTATATVEVEEDARPELMENTEELENADVLFIGSNDFSNKQIVPFATHGGNGLTNSQNELELLYPDYEFLTGFGVRGGNVEASETNLQDWLTEIGF